MLTWWDKQIRKTEKIILERIIINRVYVDSLETQQGFTEF